MTIETRPTEAPVRAHPKTASDVLRHAALIIEERGWCQYSTEDYRGGMCAWGAILTATYGYIDAHGSDDLDVPATARLAHFIGDPRGEISIGTVVTWNDEPGRTSAEVIAALRAAAD